MEGRFCLCWTERSAKNTMSLAAMVVPDIFLFCLFMTCRIKAHCVASGDKMKNKNESQLFGGQAYLSYRW